MSQLHENDKKEKLNLRMKTSNNCKENLQGWDQDWDRGGTAHCLQRFKNICHIFYG